MNEPRITLSKLFWVYARPKTYLNLIYLLLAFPLGVCYFIFLITGLSVGLSLVIIIIGLIILILIFPVSWLLIAFERGLAIHLLRVPIPPLTKKQAPGTSLWDTIRSYLSDPVLWKGILYLFLKFPIGVTSFSIVITLISSSIALMASPFTYLMWTSTFWGPGILTWKIDTPAESLIGFLLGVSLLTVSLYITNFMGSVLGQFSRLMLSTKGTDSQHSPLKVQSIQENHSSSVDQDQLDNHPPPSMTETLE